MHKLAIKRSARKELDSPPDKLFLKIDDAILALKKDPFPHPQSKKLKDNDQCRLRVGDYRVIYSVDSVENTITIHRIRHRREVYR